MNLIYTNVASGTILWIAIAILSYNFSPSLSQENDTASYTITNPLKRKVAYSIIMATFIVVSLFGLSEIGL